MIRLFTRSFMLLLVSSAFLYAVEHPTLLISKSEAMELKKLHSELPLLDKSFREAVAMVESGIKHGIEVPQPGEAGGYAHERHKQNYREMHQAGILFTVTGDEKYAAFVREMLLAYAELYPKLGPHPLAHNQAPGRLFHQMLNETVWLLHTSQAYDCIYDYLTSDERDTIEKNVFRKIVDWFTTDNAHEFDRIHNHGTWSVASVGMIGYVLGDQNMVDMALYGTKKNGEGGFLKQLDMLFSPDGYYMEGPYYIRYALRPFFYFAEAIERNQPELKIFEYRDQILRKAHYSAVQTIFPNGVLPPINDASRSMNITAPGIVLSNDIVYDRYGADPNLLAIAKMQDQVILNNSGIKIAKDLASSREPAALNWSSVEFTDGHDGKRGGLGILRSGSGKNQSMLLMKYGVHGEGHGHFDKLHFIFFDRGREVIPDYGYSRWINIEPKFGGRYLPENKSYAMQTVAHNTVVVDGECQNNRNRKEADKVWGERHFFDASNEKIQAMSARANQHYPGVKMQRSMLLIEDEMLDSPMIVDLYRLTSASGHTYDYPLHFRGQIISTTLDLKANVASLKPLGDKAGYEHIWNEAGAEVDGPFRFTWLDGDRYYSWISTASAGAKLFVGRTGANDPNFNLISEPLALLRTKGSDYLFASVIEPHGYFNEAAEKSVKARGKIQSVRIIGHNEIGSVIEIETENHGGWRVMVSNGEASAQRKNSVTFNDTTYEWDGNFRVIQIADN